mmetsp:Transcript_9761/g.23887  ORF Transcript_9761/g.23887 Transcript_9761/m.23887 type:complete len:210 (-) Transcript_9761:88-717(-)
MTNAGTSFDALSTVAVSAQVLTNPASPFALYSGPNFPVFNEYVVEHVGHATRGWGPQTSASVKSFPLNKSNPHRGHVPSTARYSPSTFAHAIVRSSPKAHPRIFPCPGNVTPVISWPRPLLTPDALPRPFSSKLRFKFPPLPRRLPIMVRVNAAGTFACCRLAADGTDGTLVVATMVLAKRKAAAARGSSWMYQLRLEKIIPEIVSYDG